MERQTACQTDCCSIDHVIGQYIAPSETLSTTIRLSQPIYQINKNKMNDYNLCIQYTDVAAAYIVDKDTL